MDDDDELVGTDEVADTNASAYATKSANVMKRKHQL